MTEGLPRGFPKPTYFQVPDDLVDVWAPHLTGAELKVILYICRRTSGFGKVVDAISYQQFHQGILTHDGRQLDNGAGVSSGILPKTLARLEDLGLITVERSKASDGSKAVNVYRLCWREEQEVKTAPKTRRRTSKTDVPRPRTEVGVPRKLMIQETVLQETERIERSVIERLSDQVALAMKTFGSRDDVAQKLSAFRTDPDLLERVVLRSLAGWQKGQKEADFWLDVQARLR